MAEAYDREREENMRLRRALYALTCAVAADQTGSGSRAELLAENASALGVLFPDSDSPNTPVTDAEPSTPASTRAQGPRSV